MADRPIYYCETSAIYYSNGEPAEPDFDGDYAEMVPADRLRKVEQHCKREAEIADKEAKVSGETEYFYGRRDAFLEITRTLSPQGER